MKIMCETPNSMEKKMQKDIMLFVEETSAPNPKALQRELQDLAEDMLEEFLKKCLQLSQTLLAMGFKDFESMEMIFLAEVMDDAMEVYLKKIISHSPLSEKFILELLNNDKMRDFVQCYLFDKNLPLTPWVELSQQLKTDYLHAFLTNYRQLAKVKAELQPSELNMDMAKAQFMKLVVEARFNLANCMLSVCPHPESLRAITMPAILSYMFSTYNRPVLKWLLLDMQSGLQQSERIEIITQFEIAKRKTFNNQNVSDVVYESNIHAMNEFKKDLFRGLGYALDDSGDQLACLNCSPEIKEAVIAVAAQSKGEIISVFETLKAGMIQERKGLSPGDYKGKRILDQLEQDMGLDAKPAILEKSASLQKSGTPQKSILVHKATTPEKSVAPQKSALTQNSLLAQSTVPVSKPAADQTPVNHLKEEVYLTAAINELKVFNADEKQALIREIMKLAKDNNKAATKLFSMIEAIATHPASPARTRTAFTMHMNRKDKHIVQYLFLQAIAQNKVDAVATGLQVMKELNWSVGMSEKNLNESMIMLNNKHGEDIAYAMHQLIKPLLEAAHPEQDADTGKRPVL